MEKSMLTRRDAIKSIAGAGGLAALPSVAFAQEAWPARELHVICPFTTGSGADFISRFYARKLQEISGKSVIVENKVGAQGSIASEYVARSKPDGYTIYIIPGMNVFASAPYVFKKLPYDPINDFEHIGTLAVLPLLLVVSANSPYRTVAELVADMKSKGDKASYAAISNTSLFCCELFKANFGLQTVDVKFKDFPSALNEFNAGNAVFTYLDAPQALGHIKAGRIRALAATVQREFPPALDAQPGFERFYLVKTAEDAVTVVIVWSSQETAATGSAVIGPTLFHDYVVPLLRAPQNRVVGDAVVVHEAGRG
jgi:tripartite-type tricarboxylate transporter receptor subunit TctC